MLPMSVHNPYFNIILRRDSKKHILRLRHYANSKQKSVIKTSKVAADVVNYLENTPEYEDIKADVPRMLLKKYKTPENMYLVNKSTAKKIANTIGKHLHKNFPIVEVNPGFGFLTEELLKQKSDHLYLYESSHYFTKYLTELQNRYSGRITYKVADFFGMWKLAFQDKMDQGNRIQELLGELTYNSHDKMVNIVGSMPGLGFVKHMINNIVFHNTSNLLGRPNLFITMPGHHYEFLTDNEVQHNKQKSIPALFQMLFDFKILTNVPKVHFLPWTHPSSNKRVTVMDEYYLYLVNITEKKKLPCPKDYLPLLWYFFKPHIFSKSTRVIPMLEQWIPGCGIWLITGQDPPDTNKELAPDENDATLPHMSIFTEFGDLNLKQKITVFKRFISWPEFEQCPFRVTMENNLPKSVTNVDSDKDTIGTHIDDDDDDHTDTENDT